jgi:hypothetical protein
VLLPSRCHLRTRASQTSDIVAVPPRVGTVSDENGLGNVRCERFCDVSLISSRNAKSHVKGGGVRREALRLTAIAKCSWHASGTPTGLSPRAPRIGTSRTYASEAKWSAIM